MSILCTPCYLFISFANETLNGLHQMTYHEYISKHICQRILLHQQTYSSKNPAVNEPEPDDIYNQVAPSHEQPSH